MQAELAEQGSKPPTKFQLRRERTRADLLALGFERFPVKGYAQTSIEDIVRESGYTRGAFYFHFDSKEIFFLEVLRNRPAEHGNWLEVLDGADVVDLRSALAAVVARFAHATPRKGSWTLLTAEFVDANRDCPELLTPLTAFRHKAVGELAPLIAWLQDRGWARTDVPARDLAAQLLAVTDGFGVCHELYGSDPSPLMDVYLRLLEPR